MLVCSLPLKSRKWLTCDVFDPFATHFGFVCDVTDTHCLVVFSGLSNLPFFFFIDKIGQKMYLFSEKVCVCFFDYISVKRVHDASLLWFPFKSILNLKILSILCAVRGVWLVLTKQIC